MIDEVKSIPDLLMFGLSLFNKEDRSALADFVASISFDTIKKMFEDKADKYTNQGLEVAFREGGYDAVQIASIFYGGAFIKGSKATKTAGEIDDFVNKAKDLLDKITDQTTLTKIGDLGGDVESKLLKDIADNPNLLDAVNGNSELVDAWKKMDDLHADDAIRKNPGALDALNKPNGSRPDPSTYLDATYINSHLSKFDDGVTKFLSDAPTGAVGPPSGTFVIPKSQADELIKQAGGDVHKLEDLLGLERGTLGTNPVRIDVANPSGARMPSGNELGANENWIPGGKTSGGVLEATVDQIQPGTFITGSVF
ncbi:MAG TPA: hypothetical protein VL728_00985 [Cyclobacteriaceae bacterium]|nr:hypothetical protein [Cyclobacteriaceae bacterium]